MDPYTSYQLKISHYNISTRAKIGAINAIVDLDWSDTNDAPVEVWKCCTGGPAGAVRRSIEAASRATASRPALGTATISRGRRMRRQHSASCRCGEPPRSFGISARPLGHAADADEPPDGSWVAALPPWTSWSAHAPGDTLLASKCDGDLTLLCVASSRVVLLCAPSLVALASDVHRVAVRAHGGLVLPSREDDNFPGRGAGRLVALCRHD